MAERLNLMIDDGIGAMLTELAGGERKRGQWISDMVRAIHEQQQQAMSSDLEAIRLGFAGLAGTVKTMEGRLMTVERNLAVLMAEKANG